MRGRPVLEIVFSPDVRFTTFLRILLEFLLPCVHKGMGKDHQFKHPM